MRLRYTFPALGDLDSILSYISVASPQGAAHVRRRIKDVIDLLLVVPHIGSRTHDPTIRRIVVRPYPYLIFYEVTPEEVIIHAVRHAARDPSTMPGAG
jgi:plasmid stabilization system protein ParE